MNDMQSLNGSLSLNGKDKILVQYSPNTLRGGVQREEVADNSKHGGAGFIDPEIKAYLAQNQETVVHEDWICEFVKLQKINMVNLV